MGRQRRIPEYTLTMWLFNFALFLIVGLAKGTDEGDGVMTSVEGNNLKSCPGLFEVVGETCFYFSSDSGVTNNWQGARDYCEDLGSLLGETIALAEIGNTNTCGMTDSLLLSRIYQKGSNVWLGASEDYTDHWIWSHSRRTLAVSDSHWYYDQPNDSGTNCLSTIHLSTYGR